MGLTRRSLQFARFATHNAQRTTHTSLRAAAIASRVPRAAAVSLIGSIVGRDVIRQAIIAEAGHFLRDMEWRYAQARELVDEAVGVAALRGISGSLDGLDAADIAMLVNGRKLTAEDLNTSRHLLTGFAVTNNSPGAGQIAWASLHIVYNGTDYAITDGNTALKYVWWAKATSTTVLQTSNTKPTLTVDDVLMFINNGGTAINAVVDSNQSMPNAVANSAVDAGAIVAAAVGTSALATGAVTSSILAAGAVTSTAMGTGAVTSTAIAAGAVLAAALGTGAVTSTAIASGAVGSSALAAGAVTSTVLASGSVTATKLNIQTHTIY